MYNLPLWYSLVSGQLWPVLLSAILHAMVVTMWKLEILDELTPQYATNYIWNWFYQLMCVADIKPQVVVVQPWKLYEFTALCRTVSYLHVTIFQCVDATSSVLNLLNA